MSKWARRSRDDNGGHVVVAAETDGDIDRWEGKAEAAPEASAQAETKARLAQRQGQRHRGRGAKEEKK